MRAPSGSEVWELARPTGKIRRATLRLHMLRRPLHRLTAAFFMAMSLLFSQLAMASYSCPAEAQAAAMAEMAASGMPCDGMDKAQPALCHEHSTSAPQSFEAVKVPVPSLPMVLQVLQLPLVLDAAEAVAIPPAGTPEARPPPDPLFLSTLRLRV
jgi:predicted small integral membrane protein